jgi:hypothetical protein
MAVNESSVKSHFRERGQINWNDPILLYPKNLIACIKHLSNEMLRFVRLCPTRRSTHLRQQDPKIALPPLTLTRSPNGPAARTIIEAPRGGLAGCGLICSGPEPVSRAGRSPPGCWRSRAADGCGHEPPRPEEHHRPQPPTQAPAASGATNPRRQPPRALPNSAASSPGVTKLRRQRPEVPAVSGARRPGADEAAPASQRPTAKPIRPYAQPSPSGRTSSPR